MYETKETRMIFMAVYIKTKKTGGGSLWLMIVLR